MVVRARGFSMFEVVIVVAVVAIGGSLAVFAMSDQVVAARARSDELGLVMRMKTERNAARERLRPLGIQLDDGAVAFHEATITVASVGARSCALGALREKVRFGDAELHPDNNPAPPQVGPQAAIAGGGGGAGPLCLDENGRPVGAFNTVIIAADGRTSTLSITPSGVMETDLDGGDDDIAAAEGASADPKMSETL